MSNQIAFTRGYVLLMRRPAKIPVGAWGSFEWLSRWFPKKSGFAQIDWWPWSYYSQQGNGASVTVPVWFLAIPFVIASVWLFRRSRHALPGHCRCGYDLAGIGDGAPCPECGARR